MNIPLTPQEIAELKPIIDVLDARAQGYREGIEASKRVLIETLLKRRTTHDTEQPNATGNATAQGAARSPTDAATSAADRAGTGPTGRSGESDASVDGADTQQRSGAIASGAACSNGRIA